MTPDEQKKPQQRDPVAFLTGRLSDQPWPEGISLPGGGGKFATDGSVQLWPGNTFVCHVPPGPAQDQLRALQEEVKLSRFARLFTFLPPSSFHMTVFQGLSPRVPKDYDLTLRDAQSQVLLERTQGLAFDQGRKVRMVDLFCAHSVTVTGQDPKTEGELRQARHDLRRNTGIEPADFDSYVFHITLAYVLEWLTEPTARALAAFSAELRARHAPLLAEITLGPVEFCTFDTMHHFAPLRQMV